MKISYYIYNNLIGSFNLKTVFHGLQLGLEQYSLNSCNALLVSLIPSLRYSSSVNNFLFMGNMFFLISNRYIHVYIYVFVYLNDNANIVITIYCRYYYIVHYNYYYHHFIFTYCSYCFYQDFCS